MVVAITQKKLTAWPLRSSAHIVSFLKKLGPGILDSVSSNFSKSTTKVIKKSYESLWVGFWLAFVEPSKFVKLCS